MKMKLRGKFLFTQACSIILLSVILAVIAISTVTNRIHVMTEEELFIALEGFSGDVNYLRDVGKEIDITVFTGSERTESSIKGAVGTYADSKIIKTVLEGQQPYFDTNVKVNGISYCGYYIPTETGMLFAGEPNDYLNAIRTSIALNLLSAALVIGVISIVITAFIVIRITYHSA